MHAIQRFEIGQIALEARNWHFGVAGEAGFYWKIGDYFTPVSLLFNAKYNYAFKGGTSLNGESQEFPYWSFTAGIAFTP